MNLENLKALSLFSGCGGMDLGVSQAGFDVLASVERDPYCCESLRVNKEYQGTSNKIVEADIRSISPKVLADEIDLKIGELDLLFGGPPCQAFSQIGKQKGLEDERGLLLFEMVRFARVLKPKVVFIEQVKGLVNAKDVAGRRGGILKALLDELTQIGYVSKWKVINAADFGVPQKRQRLFIVATLDENGFEFPYAEFAEQPKPTLFGSLKPYVTVGQAIAGLGEPEVKDKNGFTRTDSHVDPTPAGDKYRINGVPEGLYLSSQVGILPPEQIKGLTKKDTTKFLRTSRFSPSNTLRGGEIFFHPTKNRYLTPREYLRIHGFPDEFILEGPIRGRSGRVKNLDQYRQIANSVPPSLAKVIAEKIRGYLCQKSLNFSVTA